MRVFSHEKLKAYYQKKGGHADAQGQLDAWYDAVVRSNWGSSRALKEDFPKARLVKDLVIFNIKGNTYRLIVQINYEIGIVNIRFFGTHAEYSKFDDVTEI